MQRHDLSHSATALVEAPADVAFDFLVDPIALGRWSLGCMDVEPAGPDGLYTGRSLFDGARSWFTIAAHRPLFLIDYHVGSAEQRSPRISARVTPAAVADLADNQCLVTMTAWRAGGMSDARWRRLCAAHETEILLIKAQIETGRR